MKLHVLIPAILLCGTLGLTASAKDKAAEAKPLAPSPELDVAAALNGHLLSLVDGKAQDYVLEGDPEYFILYHSASW